MNHRRFINLLICICDAAGKCMSVYIYLGLQPAFSCHV